MNFNLNLNDNSLLGNGTTIFNNGDAGRVKNVSIRIEPRPSDAAGNQPDVKIYYTDENGGSINDGYYRYAPNDSKSDEDNAKAARLRIGRLLAVANCVIPEGFQYPDTTNMTPSQVEDTLFNIIATNATPEKRVNVFVTYGRKTAPKQYLQLRTFNFIERADVSDNATRLRVNVNDDQMERINPDTPANGDTGLGGGFGSIPPASNNTGGFWNAN